MRPPSTPPRIAELTAIDSHPDASEALRAAFRELHGARLHGFALLLTLGDREHAARLAATALAMGAERAASLRHPERAAAWLRARIVRDAGRVMRRDLGPLPAHRAALLRPLGVTPEAAMALGALTNRDRALLVAGAVERLDELDVATIVGSSPSRTRRALRDARRRYAAAYAAALRDEDVPAGALSLAIGAAAGRALG